MISRDRVRELLAPFEISLPDERIDKLIGYVDLLLRWNSKINLTSITNVDECITRHFGECFLASRIVQLHGRLLDIGSGAGFPGLALKLIAPQLEVTLLEPVAKKRAFLKEVSRVCGLGPIEVNANRLDGFARSHAGTEFDIITTRAVGGLPSLVAPAEGLLRLNGHLCLWMGRKQAQCVRESSSGLEWWKAEAIPLSQDRIILVGVRRESSFR